MPPRRPRRAPRRPGPVPLATTALVGGLLLTVAATSGCAPDRAPTWAADSLWITVDPDGGFQALQTWSVYGPRWDRNHRQRHFACAVVVALTLEPVDEGCAGCALSWEVVEGRRTDTDCDGEPIPDAALPTALGVGPIAAELADEGPVDGLEAGTWIRYDGTAWTAHGWAWPGIDAAPATADTLDPTQEGITGWPAWAWDLRAER
jgi:hypothetical protein